MRIFAGFRLHSDQNRYVFGLRGGNNNDLFLARYGDNNKHAFLGTTPLGFIPQKGVWYTIRIDVEGSNIQVYLNNEPSARLTANDPEAPFLSGKIALGGGWSKTEFDSVKVSPLTEYTVHKDALHYNFQSLKDATVTGWTPVDESRYTKEKGIGWTDDGLFSRKRNVDADPLADSLVGFSDRGSKVLRVDLPDGDYIVSVNMGDPSHRSQNRIFFMDEQQSSIDTASENGNNNLLRKSITTYNGQLRMRFELDKPGHGVSINWLTIEPRKLAGDTAWRKYDSAETKNDTPDKVALRKTQRAAYQARQIEAPQDGRTTYSLNGDWLFLPDYEVGQSIPWDVQTDDSSWHVIDVPTFWTPMMSWNYSEGEGASKGRASKNYWEKEKKRCAAYTFDAPRTKTGYYRHTLILPDILKDKTVQINFDAIGRESQVWVNGTSVAEYTGMFAPVRADITKWVKPGANIVVVRAGDSLKNQEYNTRDIGRAPLHMFFLENRGIWQNVTLEISDSVTIDDTFFKPQLNRFDLDVTLKNRSGSPAEYKLATQIRDHKNNRLVYDASTTRTNVVTEAGQTKTITLRSDDQTHAPFKNWSPEFPNLYRAEIFAFNYNQDPSVDLKSFSDQAVVFQTFKNELFTTDLVNGDYVVTLEFGDATQPSLAEAYIGRDVNALEQAIV
ncbi:MAG: hypothetical protein FJ220_05975, partial [Kiritimatiellaceae bacterium]|nr:hypothetical protein [Kiritimatiellaceae bacterium]